MMLSRAINEQERTLSRNAIHTEHMCAAPATYCIELTVYDSWPNLCNMYYFSPTDYFIVILLLLLHIIPSLGTNRYVLRQFCQQVAAYVACADQRTSQWPVLLFSPHCMRGKATISETTHCPRTNGRISCMSCTQTKWVLLTAQAIVLFIMFDCGRVEYFVHQQIRSRAETKDSVSKLLGVRLRH